MPLITAAELRHHIETDLPDTELEQVVAAEEYEITKRLGNLDGMEQAFIIRALLLMLPLAAASVTSVVESGHDLDPGNYELTNGGLSVTRLVTGNRPSFAWLPPVRVAFVPEGNVAQRRLLMIQLVKLNLAFSGYLKERGPEMELIADDPLKARERLFDMYDRGVMFV